MTKTKQSPVKFHLTFVHEHAIDSGFEAFALGGNFVDAVNDLIQTIQRNESDTEDTTYYYTLEDDGMYRVYEEEALSENNVSVQYVSEWDGGTKEIMTTAIFNTTTGQVYDIMGVDGDDVDVLDREYIILPDGSKMLIEERFGKYYAVTLTV